MGIAERREREREQRRLQIIESAWQTAEQVGWGTFSVEKVAAHAELGRATIYGYFESLEALVTTMAEQALAELSNRVAQAPGIAEALDVPVRFSQARPAAFALLFPPAMELRAAFDGDALRQLRQRARQMIGRLERLATKAGATLPDDAQSASAFLAGISLAGAVVPELRSSTPLRRRWQDFCLGLSAGAPMVDVREDKGEKPPEG